MPVKHIRYQNGTIPRATGSRNVERPNGWHLAVCNCHRFDALMLLRASALVCSPEEVRAVRQFGERPRKHVGLLSSFTGRRWSVSACWSLRGVLYFRAAVPECFGQRRRHRRASSSWEDRDLGWASLRRRVHRVIEGGSRGSASCPATVILRHLSMPLGLRIYHHHQFVSAFFFPFHPLL